MAAMVSANGGVQLSVAKSSKRDFVECVTKTTKIISKLNSKYGTTTNCREIIKKSTKMGAMNADNNYNTFSTSRCTQISGMKRSEEGLFRWKPLQGNFKSHFKQFMTNSVFVYHIALVKCFASFLFTLRVVKPIKMNNICKSQD